MAMWVQEGGNLGSELGELGRSDINRFSSENADVRFCFRGWFFLLELGWKVMYPVVQSINRLCWMSQLYLSINEQEELREITYTFRIIWWPDGKVTGREAILEIM